MTSSGVLLATARVLVRDSRGTQHAVRALVDPASDASLVAESLVQRLRVTRSRGSTVVLGVGERAREPSSGSVRLVVSSRIENAHLDVVAFVLRRVTTYSRRVDNLDATWPHLQGLPLADPDLQLGDPVELLLGGEVYPAFLRPGVRGAGPRAPVAQETSLGWIITGPTLGPGESSAARVHVCSVDDQLLDRVRAFWEQEEAPSPPRQLTEEERRCEDHYKQTVTRDRTGRFTVRLPTAGDLPDFSESHRAALGSLRSMERRFKGNPELHRNYDHFMGEYASLGHMTPARPPVGPHPAVCYLPHHGVVKGAGAAVKLRVVFNGSARLRSGDTLNNHLLVGPNMVPVLSSVLLRWRLHRFVLVADIEKMYRQIQVHPDDWRLQRILWRPSGADDIMAFSLTTVTYGLSCAPFLAVRTLRLLAEEEETRYPRAAAALREHTYVDDILSGGDSLEEAEELRDQLRQLCLSGGFPLRRWAANTSRLLKTIPDRDRADQGLVEWESVESQSTLGLQWNARHDCFSYRIRPMAETPVTRRTVLSRTAGLYDPLGWLAPVIVSAKIFVQRTWLLRLGWDDPLAEGESSAWQRIERALPLLEDIRVPRWLGPANADTTSAEFHGFADASERAYAAVVYLRIPSDKGGARVSLVVARTKVAPLRQISLPRLELNAALMLAQLLSHVRELLKMTAIPVHMWSDSTVTLGWIKGHPSRWTTFVANRVADIQRLLPGGQWHHVPSEHNPADCASRGLLPDELRHHSLWWTGPTFLAEGGASSCGASELVRDEDLTEQRRATHVVATVQEENEILGRFSSWHRLLRVTSWILRWRCPAAARPRGPLSSEELRRSQTVWVVLQQAGEYPDELTALGRGKPIHCRSPLLPLSPLIDAEGVLRVGGRLRHASMGEDTRQPIILPPRARVTQLVIEAAHRRALHGGVQITLALIRHQFWIPRGRCMVRQTIHRCPTCARWQAAAPQPTMADLPKARVTVSRPFSNTGVDYAGPIHVRTSKGRGHRAQKAFICVFVCLSTRAIHLELVSDYTAEAFLAAYRRFVSRRGLCRELRSDCGTNFVGADTQLRELLRGSGSGARRIADRLAGDGVRWRFNPPAAPHFGGIWEAAVKSVKHHLRRVIGDTTLTFEEMTTFLAEVEACLNSRPLQALSDDPNDLEAMTPGHFLIGAPLVSLPEPLLTEVPTSRLTRWRLLQQMRDHFWQRWSAEYVTALLPRPKWRKEAENLRVGQLGLIRSQPTPPSRWPLARVIAVHPGSDGRVRVVTVRTAAGDLVRPAVKVIPLPGVTASGDDEGRRDISETA